MASRLERLAHQMKALVQRSEQGEQRLATIMEGFEDSFREDRFN